YHLAQRGLGDLVDGGGDVLDGDERLGGVDDPVVGDGRDVDADVVAGDDPLGLDRHGDDPQRDAPEDVDHGHDPDEAGLLEPDHPTQPEEHALLVLLHDAQRQRQHNEGEHRDPGE